MDQFRGQYNIMNTTYFEPDPLWYKDAIIYQLHVKAFCDWTGDGIGDFKGLKNKLDYLEGLGVTALWLLPFYPSPLRDDGYDTADYMRVHPDYGTLKDFKAFLKAAHERGIRVITELVLNHTSNEHKWFQRAQRAKPGSRERDYYVWSDTPDRYKDARIIFTDFETSNWTWDSVAGAYYWHRFYSHQPDLNYHNPEVQKAMLRVIDFWFSMGVDGVRLDAVPYLYEREGTNCENLPETHQFLKILRAHVDAKFKDKMLLAEANQWPEDAAAYFGSGDECHTAFHFPLMPRMFMALHMEDSFPIIDILRSIPAIPDGCQWALFLRNHDELTLEMVTDEERDYMYRVYAKEPRAKINLGIRRRLAPLLGNSRRRIDLMYILLLSFPGTPVIYYGDEIGMGDNYYLGDRNGVRTPMQWNADRNAGFSQANPQKLYLPVIIDPEYRYEAVNVETQERNSSSLLWWMRRVIAMRKRFQCFSRGTLEIVPSDNLKVLSFTRNYQDETMLVVANLSRFSQPVALNLSRYAGCTPEEVFSQINFPPVKETPYELALGPHNHYWFLLHKQKEVISVETAAEPVVNISGTWETILIGKHRQELERQIFPRYLKRCRWFGAKGRAIRNVKIVEDIRICNDASSCHVLLLEVSYREGADELYLLPLSFSVKPGSQKVAEGFPQGIIACLRVGDTEGVMYDSTYDKAFHKALLATIAHRRKIKGASGDLIGLPGKQFRRLLGEKGFDIASQALKAEQSNTAIIYDDRLFLKLYRRLDEGIHPDCEIVRFLTEETVFSNIPIFAGAIEYRREHAEPITVALLQGFVANVGDVWTYTLDVAARYFERALSKTGEVKEIVKSDGSLLDIDLSNIPPLMEELIGGLYLEIASLLGKRTGELHLALGSRSDVEPFAPEPFSLLYQRAVYQSMQSLVARTMQSLAHNFDRIPGHIRDEAQAIVTAEQDIVRRMKRILEKKFSAMKIRIHGDYHLGQILYTGKDFVIMDFEGEPARPLGERRLKRSPLRDVAGMIRSFHYAAYSALSLRSSFRPEDVALLELWIEPWYYYISGIFLHSYLDTVGDAPFLPKERDELEILLNTFLLEKAVYELGYEINNRPDWIIIPVRGIQSIMKRS
jgi:maltose alpha-D-glucosyltransferase/alpha-amylase